MEEARIIGVRALADFVMAMVAMKAQWYNLMVPSFLDPSRVEINAVFPLLSLLLNLDIINMEKLPEVCGLSR